MKRLNGNTGIAAAQWFVFLLANSLTLPIVIGQTYHLPAADIAGLMQRTFFVVGLSSMLSGWLGHRLPIPDGPAGIWLGVFVLMGEMAATSTHGTDGAGTLQLLEGGMLVTGATMALIGAAGWVNRLLRVFTPLVTGVYLLLLAFQLSGVFLKGMLGASDPAASVPAAGAAIAFGVFLLVLMLSIAGKGWMKSYAVLIGIIVGWLAFVLTKGSHPLAAGGEALRLPDLFAWGTPRLDEGMILSAFMVALVLISNVIASVSAMRQVLDEERLAGDTEAVDPGYLNRGGLIGGISNMLSSVFSTVGVVPLSIAAGFVRMTGQHKKAPYIAACLALIVVSFIPVLYSLLAMLPGPVAYAAMLASFAQMVGIGLSSVVKGTLDQRRLTIIGVSLSLGTGVMFLPQTMFVGLPSLLQYILSNGLLIGMLIALVLEQAWRSESGTSTASIR